MICLYVVCFSSYHTCIYAECKEYTADCNCEQLYTKALQAVVVAEWLRRWTRNPLGSSRAGSNPADNEYFISFLYNYLLLSFHLNQHIFTSDTHKDGIRKWYTYYQEREIYTWFNTTCAMSVIVLSKQ